MTVHTKPSWWRLTTEVPPEWTTAFATLTSDEGTESFGLAAAIFISRTRKRTGRGPTFAELFAEIQTLNPALAPQWPDDASKSAQRTTLQFYRYLVAAHWKREGWINFDRGLERSLRTGRTFRQRSRERQRQRGAES